MTADMITAIKKALEGVTPGPWFMSGVRFRMNGSVWHSVNRYDESLKRDEGIACVGYDERTGAGLSDAQYIAAVNPEAITDLLSVLESLQRENEETLETYYERQIGWSRETFGPALRTKGIIDHIKKELGEIEADPHDLSEWVDVVILAMDGFWRHGGNAGDLFKALIAKQQKNMARTWPDWRTMSEDSAIEHDRTKDAPRAALSSTGDTHGN